MDEVHTATIVTSDGHEFEMTVFEPRSGARATLLFFPAMGVKASYYRGFAAQVAEVGVRVAIADLRGLGTSSVRAKRGVDYGYADILERDLPAAIAAIGGGPLYLGGHSLGGQLSLLRAPMEDIAGVVLVATCLPHHVAWPGLEGLRVRALSPLFRAIARVAGYFPGDRVGFGGREGRTLINDWAETVSSGRYAPAGSDVDWESPLVEMATPVLAVHIEGDDWAPPAAIDALLAKAPMADHVRVSAPSGAGGHPHFAWAKNPARVVDAIDQFIL